MLNQLTLRAERQSARMSKITNDGLTRSGTGCFIAVPTETERVMSVHWVAVRTRRRRLMRKLIMVTRTCLMTGVSRGQAAGQRLASRLVGAADADSGPRE